MSAKPGSWRGGFCRRARVQPGVRCFHRVGCEKSGTAGCPPNMENGAGFGRLVGKTVGKVPAGHKSGGRPVRFCAWRSSLFRSAVGAFFAKRRAANPARPGRAHGAKRRKQIFLKRAAASAALSLRSAFRGVAALSLRSVRRRLCSPFRRVPLPHLFFITDVRETGFMARRFLPPRKGAAGCALFSPCRL